MDKVILKFFADVLYIRGFLYSEEYEAILDCRNMYDLDDVIEDMLSDKCSSSHKRGECYVKGKAIPFGGD